MDPCAQVVNPLWGHHLGSDPEDGRRSRPFVDPSSPSPLKEFFVHESPSPVLAEPPGSDDEVVPESPLPSPPSLTPSPHTGPQPMTQTPVVSPPQTTPPETVPRNPTGSKQWMLQSSHIPSLAQIGPLCPRTQTKPQWRRSPESNFCIELYTFVLICI